MSVRLYGGLSDTSPDVYATFEPPWTDVKALSWRRGRLVVVLALALVSRSSIQNATMAECIRAAE